MTKKEVRAAFRKAVFERDKYRCRVCGTCGRDRQGGEDHLHFFGEALRNHNGLADILPLLDSHHITPRKNMPNGGYVPENGVSLCDGCHVKAEEWFTNSMTCWAGFHPAELYELIGSSEEEAREASKKIG